MKKKRKNPSRHAALALLMKGSATVYDLERLLEEPWVEDFWGESRGVFNTRLGEIAADGYAKVTVEKSKVGREKKTYTITEEGEEEFAAWTRAHTEASAYTKDEHLLRLLLGEETEQAHVLMMLEGMRDKASHKSLALEAIDPTTLTGYEALLHKLSCSRHEVYTQWLEEAIAYTMEKISTQPTCKNKRDR